MANEGEKELKVLSAIDGPLVATATHAEGIEEGLLFTVEVDPGKGSGSPVCTVDFSWHGVPEEAKAMAEAMVAWPEMVKALRGLLSGPSDDWRDAVTVDGNYNPAPEGLLLTPRQIAESKARVALKKAGVV